MRTWRAQWNTFNSIFKTDLPLLIAFWITSVSKHSHAKVSQDHGVIFFKDWNIFVQKSFNYIGRKKWPCGYRYFQMLFFRPELYKSLYYKSQCQYLKVWLSTDISELFQKRVVSVSNIFFYLEPFAWLVIKKCGKGHITLCISRHIFFKCFYYRSHLGKFTIFIRNVEWSHTIATYYQHSVIIR